MLPKTHRLTKKKEFQKVFQKGAVIRNDFLILKTLKNRLGKSRFGFIVNKKISRRSVERNKVKRLLRKAVFDNFKKIKSPQDVVIIALPKIKEKSFFEIEETINKIFINTNKSSFKNNKTVQ